MKCKKCFKRCIKAGIQKNGTQKYFCKTCRKYRQKEYRNNACAIDTNENIKKYLKEGCGIRSISRLLKISSATVIKRIKLIGKETGKPMLSMGKEYEMDEINTYIGNKKSRYWIAYAIRKDTREVADFRIGKRTKRTLKKVTETLKLAEATKIHTDKLNLYQYLISPKQHQFRQYGINRIERKNLTLRTHLKRLNRKTISYSKSLLMLAACLKIYFWG